MIASPLLIGSLAHLPWASGVIAAAVEVEKLRCLGATLGLTKAETDEVRDVWAAHHHARPSAFSWDEAWRAVVLRAAGEEWRPRRDTP